MKLLNLSKKAGRKERKCILWADRDHKVDDFIV